MSPEVCENLPYTFKSDVWSLGCVLYEMCVLKHAFSASNLLGLVYKIVSNTYDPIPSRYSEDLSDLIRSLLTKKASDRASVEELLESPYVVRFMSDFVAKKGSLENAQRPKPRGIEHQSPYKQSPGETPKEAVARRKREAADEEAETLKCAIKDVAERKQFAKQLRDEQMNRTCTAGTSWRKDHNGEANETIIPQRRSLQETFRREPLDDSFGEDTWKFSTRSLIDLTDDGKTNESSETYEDDFEEESEDDMSTTNKSDFSRVMDNYQQQLTPENILRELLGNDRPIAPKKRPIKRYKSKTTSVP